MRCPEIGQLLDEIRRDVLVSDHTHRGMRGGKAMEERKHCENCADPQEAKETRGEACCDSKQSEERPKIPESIARILARGFT